jgi:NitT/TauT family transport system permease protein
MTGPAYQEARAAGSGRAGVPPQARGPAEPGPASAAAEAAGGPGPGAARRLRRGGPWRRALGLLLSLLIGVGAYYLATLLSSNVPSYGSLISTLGSLAGSFLWTDIRASLIRVGVGFALAAVTGTAAGCLMGWYAPLRLLFEPWVQFIRMVPSLAFIPLVIVFLGIGETPKILVIGLSAFLAITVSVMLGVRNVDPIYLRAARTLGASTGVMFRRVILPATLPYMLVGFRLGLANAWTTVVAAELIASSSGLGYLIENASQYNETPQIIIGIVFIGLIGLLMDQIMHQLERRLGSWQERAR